MKLIYIILIVVILSAGLVMIISKLQYNITTITQNPNTYLNEHISVTGILHPIREFEFNEIGIDMKIENQNGFYLYVNSSSRKNITYSADNPYLFGEKYTVKGVLTDGVLCTCMYYFYSSRVKSSYWIHMYDFPIPVQRCNIWPGHQCKEGSNETYYYINANSIQITD
jgi:hypothetical protein